MRERHDITTPRQSPEQDPLSAQIARVELSEDLMPGGTAKALLLKIDRRQLTPEEELNEEILPLKVTKLELDVFDPLFCHCGMARLEPESVSQEPEQGTRFVVRRWQDGHRWEILEAC